jgi:protein-glutamine gamma-glutamyltransferase
MAAPAALTSSLPSQPAERFFHGSLFFLVFTSVGTLVGTGKLDPITSLVVPLAMLYKGFRWWRGKPPEISHRLATWLVISYLGIFPVDVFFFSRAFVAGSTNPELLSALLGAIHFLLFVMLARLYSARSDRDALFLAMLAFAGILAASILTIDTSFLLLFFIFLLFAVATFIGMELRRGARGAIPPLCDPPTAQDRRLSRALSLTAASVAIGAFVIGGALFFVFPRFSAGYLGRASMQPSLMTGFNDNVELGQIGALKRNSEVVMRVKTGRPIGYPMLRWRGIALTHFDGKRWTNPDRYAETLTPNSEGWIEAGNPEQQLDRSAAALQYTVLLQPIATDAVFTLGNIVSVQGNFAGEGSNSEWTIRHSYLFRDFTGSLSNPFHNYAAVRYNALSRLPRTDVAKLRQASSDYPEEIRASYLQLPPVDRRVVDLASQVSARSPTTYDKAVAIEGFLRNRFTYTLNLTGSPGDDPLAHFLFVTRAGHCEYFASAMAIMLRTLGIPTREVNGFLPGEYNDIAGDYIVRASDAHSWVEVYFPGTGWLTFDPTPAAASQKGGLLSRIGQYLDWAELTWSEWVINYDFAHQIRMAQSVQHNSRTWAESAQSWFQRRQLENRRWLKSWQRKHAELGVALPLGLILFLVALRYDLFRRAIRRLRLYWHLRAPESVRANPQLASRLYEELLRLLERGGLARRDSQTPLEFASTVQTSALAPAVREFTEIYAHARFGGAPCDTLRLRNLLAQIREYVRTSRGNLAAAHSGSSGSARGAA